MQARRGMRGAGTEEGGRWRYVLELTRPRSCIGRLVSTTQAGFALVHTPGIAVNRAGQGFAGGERKSVPRDARNIAELVRTRELRPVLASRLLTRSPKADTRVALRHNAGVHRRASMRTS